jgi:hypothetical protein
MSLARTICLVLGRALLPFLKLSDRVLTPSPSPLCPPLLPNPCASQSERGPVLVVMDAAQVADWAGPGRTVPRTKNAYVSFQVEDVGAAVARAVAAGKECNKHYRCSPLLVHSFCMRHQVTWCAS